jgi:starch synthase
LNIVMGASEAVPYAKTGGLADVIGALPIELAKMGHHVTLVLPRYRQFAARRHSFQSVARLRVPTGGTAVDVTLEEEIVRIERGAHPLRVLAVGYDPFFDRPGLYQDEGADYPDNLDRFVLFSRAALEAVAYVAKTSGIPVDVLHLHDWQTALCAMYLKMLDRERKAFRGIKTLLTLHNVGYQGVFPGEQFTKTGLPPALFTLSGLEFYGSVNLLKGGIIFSDAVSTVSPTYAQEIMTPAFGFGLEGVLAARKGGVQGITNGIDIDLWNPETDPYLAAHYSQSDLSGKQACKRALQRELGLPIVDVPILAVIGRLTSQKGFDLLAEVIPELMALDVQLVVLGAGDKDLEKTLCAVQSRYSHRIGLHVGFDEVLAHRIEAGADMLVMPSRYEPCGLSQLYSLRYGTVPIVRRTGGLADTVVPFRPLAVQAKRATGFHFIDASADALLSEMLLALQIYQDHDTWHSLVRAGMNTDVSWAHAANQYVQLYMSVAGERGSKI